MHTRAIATRLLTSYAQRGRSDAAGAGHSRPEALGTLHRHAMSLAQPSFDWPGHTRECRDVASKLPATAGSDGPGSF